MFLIVHDNSQSLSYTKYSTQYYNTFYNKKKNDKSYWATFDAYHLSVEKKIFFKIQS